MATTELHNDERPSTVNTMTTDATNKDEPGGAAKENSVMTSDNVQSSTLGTRIDVSGRGGSGRKDDNVAINEVETVLPETAHSSNDNRNRKAYKRQKSGEKLRFEGLPMGSTHSRTTERIGASPKHRRPAANCATDSQTSGATMASNGGRLGMDGPRVPVSPDPSATASLLLTLRDVNAGAIRTVENETKISEGTMQNSSQSRDDTVPDAFALSMPESVASQSSPISFRSTLHMNGDFQQERGYFLPDMVYSESGGKPPSIGETVQTVTTQLTPTEQPSRQLGARRVVLENGIPDRIQVDQDGFIVSSNPAQPPQVFGHHLVAERVADGNVVHQIAGAFPSARSSFASAYEPSIEYRPHAQAIHSAREFVAVAKSGKRKIKLRLREELSALERHKNFLSGLRKRKSSSRPQTLLESENMETSAIDRGTITVSWYEGTTSAELQEHVRNMVSRKLALPSSMKLSDFRVLDGSSNSTPPEEVVLSPFIPDGSLLILCFSTMSTGGTSSPRKHLQHRLSFGNQAPESPSAAPSPFPSSSDLYGLNNAQLALLRQQLDLLQSDPSNYHRFGDTGERHARRKTKKPPAAKESAKKESAKESGATSIANSESDVSPLVETGKETEKEKQVEEKQAAGTKPSADQGDSSSDESEAVSVHGEDEIEARLKEISEILLSGRYKRDKGSGRTEKRQVVFVLANYFVLFLSLIAISAEIQSRAPQWLSWVEEQLQNVRNCAADQDALFECVSNGDVAGLIASVVLWLSRSATTKRFFLFGFETPKRLWAVVYESLVTAVCWGFSYLFIRRAMNPDTRRNFLQKYWKDAVYGSLAGFNAAFMKQVLKNLIPQEALEDALQDERLKILAWLPSFSY